MAAGIAGRKDRSERTRKQTNHPIAPLQRITRLVKPNAPYNYFFACTGTICCPYGTCGVEALYPLSTRHRIYCLDSSESRRVRGARVQRGCTTPACSLERVSARSRSAGDERLNRRGEQLIGRRYELIEAIVNGRGKARVGDGQWLVSGPDLPVGSTVEVIAVEGTTLKVKPV